MRKFKRHSKKIILEHPLIHVEEWNRIVNNEYDQFAPQVYKYYLFNNGFTNRIKQECDLADSIVLLSKFSQNTFKKHSNYAQKTLLVNLYADDIFTFEDHQRLDAKVFNILFAGRIDLIKGIHRLLPVFAKIKKRFDHVNLILVGQVKEEIEHILIKYKSLVQVKEHLSKSELADEYHKANLFILPSVQESFGLVMLEALACGTPVMGSLNTGAPDIADVCNNVTVFDPFNEAEFELKLSSLIQSKSIVNSEFGLVFSKANYQKQILQILETNFV